MTEEKTIKKFFQNRDILKWIIVGLAGFAVLILVFGAGVKVGTMKAKYSYRWAENYHKNFGGPGGGFFSDWGNSPRGEFINAHGVFGEIIELTKVGLDNALVIKGRDDVEKIIITTKDTVVKKGGETMKDYLKVGDSVVIIGTPNDEGQIEAKLIRVFDGSDPRGLPYRPSRSVPFN